LRPPSAFIAEIKPKQHRIIFAKYTDGVNFAEQLHTVNFAEQ